jgi:tRNA-modifying protein YgfZ
MTHSRNEAGGSLAGGHETGSGVTHRGDELRLLRDDVAVVDRSDRGHVLVTGAEARSFLQALVSADLDPLTSGDGVRSLLLSPQGKLDVAFRALLVDDDVWLDTDPGFGAQLAESLNRFRIRVAAEVRDRSDEFGVLSVIGPAVPAVLVAGLPDALHAHVPYEGVRVVRTEHGVDLLGPNAALAGVRGAAPLDAIASAGAEAYDAWRIERGIPAQPNDIDEKTIPQEAELERDAVSFTKGCFLGQELVCRIDTRGHVNRFLRRVHVIEGDWPVPGAEVVVDGKSVGSLTSVAPADAPTGALGYVRREVDPPAAVELRWDGGHAHARVDAL